MEIDNSSALISINLLEKIKKHELLSNSEIERYDQSAGILFLKQHCNKYGGFALDKEKLRQILEKPDQWGVFGRTVLLGLDKIEYIEEIMSLDIHSMEREVINKVQKYSLIDVSQLEIKIFLLYGIRGTAIVLPEEGIGIDLCDCSLYENNRIIPERLIDVLAHEYHHICFERYCKEHKIHEQSNVDSILLGIISEGMAYEFFTHWLIDTEYKVIWERNFVDIEYKIELLKERLNQDNSVEQLEMLENELFGHELLGYTIGYHMVHSIHTRLGPDAVLNLMKTLCIFEVYQSLCL